MLVSVFLRHSEPVVVFLAKANVSQVCAFSVSVQVHSVVGMTKLTLFHNQTQDSFRSQRVLFLLELSPVHGTLYALSQVDFVLISDHTRIDVLHIVPGVCLHAPTRTLCIQASESISLGLSRHDHQV